MRPMVILLCVLFLVPSNSYAARLVVTVPRGIQEIRLLSPGTSAVLDFLKERLNVNLKSSSDRNQVERLEKEVQLAATAITEANKTHAEKIEALRKQYIDKVHITIHSASNHISPESALGDITFFYTADNTSDRIISDIIYKPVIGDIALPITTSLVLEFINPKNLIFGLAPGESLSNKGTDPEHFSFFLSELKAQDIKRIQSSMPGGFSIQVTDIHFVSQKGYKGQSGVMDVREAFPGLLGPYQAAVQRAQEQDRALREQLSKAKKLHERETRESINEFKAKAYDLKKSSVRYKGVVDQKKNRLSFEPIEPGTYIVYAPSGNGMAIFQEVTIDDGHNKLKIEALKKDPFEP